MLKDFKELCDKLQSTTKRTEKENYLREYEDNDYVKRCLFFLFNPYIITGISKKKLAKCNHNFSKTDNYNEENFNILDLLEYVREHNTGRDSDLRIVEEFAEANSLYGDFIYQLVSKDLTLGIQATTLNKVYGKDFVPVFDVMLAQRYFDDPEKYLPDGVNYILTTKLDGIRCVCFFDLEGDVRFFSRQGQPIYGLNDVEKEVKQWLEPGYVYDGELLLNNENNLESKDLYRATVKVVNSDLLVKENVVFNIFDKVNIKCFKDGYSPIPASERKQSITTDFSNYSGKWLKEVFVLYEGSDKSKIEYWLDAITSNGGEGVMINLSDGPYECKRSKHILKVKKFQSCDLKCIDIEEGTGQNKGRLGALIVEYPKNGEIYKVSVGSGFTFEDRDYFWKNKDKVINHIVEVQFFEETENQNGGYSLRFPVFKCVRDDKEEISLF